MSDPRLRKPTRRARLETPETHAIHDDGHSWAVSYADFLMVLLSFFILFFSIDGGKRSELIDQIKIGGPKKGGAGAKGLEATAVEHPSLPSGLSDKLKAIDGFIIERGKDARRLSIAFDDNIYKPGRVELPPEQVVKLKGILEDLRPYQGQINITFVGHTDPTALSVSKNRYLNDNFALSSLRATNALQKAAQAGIDPAGMYAKGAAENSRASRTLSILITPREVEQ